MSGPVLVVGVRGGVGQTVARQLVAAGCRVVGTVRTAGQFAEVRAAVPGLADLLELDLDDADTVLATLAPRLADAELAAVIVCAAQCHYCPLETESLTADRTTTVLLPADRPGQEQRTSTTPSTKGP